MFNICIQKTVLSSSSEISPREHSASNPLLQGLHCDLGKFFHVYVSHFLICKTWLILQSDHRTGVWSNGASETLLLHGF